MMKKIGFLFMLMVFVSGCFNSISSSGYHKPPTRPTWKILRVPTALNQKLMYDETHHFEVELSSAMGTANKIEVNLPTDIDFENNEMPQPLAKWLAAIDKTGGQLKYEAIKKEMIAATTLVTLLGLSLETLKFVKKWYDEYQAQKSRDEIAKNYDARLCYQEDNDLVSKVVFVKRDMRVQDNKGKQACSY
jgi:hypothetical protein